MRSGFQKFAVSFATLLLGAIVTVSPALAGSKAQTFTGEVSDSMCGAKHMMPGNAAECTRACVGKGANYALVIGDKIYTVDTNDKAALAELDKLAGQKASVKGTLDGDKIMASSVSAAK
jgi:hypothetical protein